MQEVTGVHVDCSKMGSAACHERNVRVAVLGKSNGKVTKRISATRIVKCMICIGSMDPFRDAMKELYSNHLKREVVPAHVRYVVRI